MATLTQSPAIENGSSTDPRLRELDLFSFLLILIRHIPFIVGCAVLAFVGMFIRVTRAKPRYNSTAVIILPQSNVTSAALAQQLSLNTIDLLGGGYELYADILSSHQVADRLITQFDLKKVYSTPELSDAEAVLTSMTTVQTQREGLVRVTVSDTDPKRAADLANAYFEQFDILNNKLVLSSIGETASYLRREMVQEKNALADAEVALRNLQIQNGGVVPASQTAAGVSALDTARAQMRAAEINLQALLVSETDQNPDVIKARAEIAGLARQIGELQSGGGGASTGPATSEVPQRALEYTRQLREVAFHQTLFDALAKQYQTAQASESKDPMIVQVLDPARPAVHKAWPPKTYYCVLATLIGFVVGAVLVTIKAVFDAMFVSPENAAKWRELKNVFRREVQHKA